MIAEAVQPLFAQAAFDNVGRMIVGCLAVAGGFLLGSLLTGWGTKLACHLMFRKQPPRKVYLLLRLLGGVALAILVAMLVFGEGLGGFGGSGKGIVPGAADDGKNNTQPTKKEPTEPTKKEPPTTKKDELPAEEIVRVTMLGGEDVKDERFYLIEKEQKPLTFEELKDRLGRRLLESRKPLKQIDIYVYKDSVARGAAAVTQLEEWARMKRIKVAFPPVADEPRPR